MGRGRKWERMHHFPHQLAVNWFISVVKLMGTNTLSCMDKRSFLHIVPVLVQQKHSRTSCKVIRVKAGEIVCNPNQVSHSGEPCTRGDAVPADRRGCAGSVCGLSLLECLLTRAGLQASTK